MLTTSVYIVDMNVTGTTMDWPSEVAIAGEDVEFSVSVTTSPHNVPVPYQWMVNGTNLPSNHTKYQGTQNNTLTILNVQDDDQGYYTCSVAHSVSGTRINSTTLRVGELQLNNHPERLDHNSIIREYCSVGQPLLQILVRSFALMQARVH